LGGDQDYRAAKEWLLKAVDQGDLIAHDWLGTLYKDGLGVSRDCVEPLSLFHMAANHGLSSAELASDAMYRDGHGGEQDDMKAHEWYLKSADQGNSEAQLALGGYYIRESGTAASLKSREWWQKAANQGNAVSQHNLGVAYLNGIGGEKDEQQAIHWFQLSADQGHERAQKEIDRLIKEKESKGFFSRFF
jgi:TPR repeat protein